MRIEIGSAQADHWFEQVCNALVGWEAAYAAEKEEVRTYTIRRENKVLRWIPFAKLIPLDTPFDEVADFLSITEMPYCFFLDSLDQPGNGFLCLSACLDYCFFVIP